MTDQLFIGEKVRLTELKKSDIERITGWYRFSDFARMYDGTPARPRPQENWEEWYNMVRQDKEGYNFAIRTLEDDDIIGLIDITGILWNSRCAWLGIAIGSSEHYGKGYGSEAMRLLMKFAFYELNLHRLQLTVFEYNTRAIALYEKLGFVKEGTYREFLERDGKRYDMMLYGLLRREWIAQYEPSSE